jgi:hypothetical protein
MFMVTHHHKKHLELIFNFHFNFYWNTHQVQTTIFVFVFLKIWPYLEEGGTSNAISKGLNRGISFKMILKCHKAHIKSITSGLGE